jgi:hypothetical protein
MNCEMDWIATPVRRKRMAKRSVLWAAIAVGIMLAWMPACLAQLATVKVQTQPLGLRIPRDFLGYSMEVSVSGQGLQPYHGREANPVTASEQPQYALGRPDVPNQSFFQFMLDLGHGVLRLGGNSQDNTCWDPAHAPHPAECRGTLTAQDLALFSKAAAATGWQLIVGLNLKQNSPSWALNEVTAGIAREMKPGEIFALEIGNEPDLFRRGGRPASYSPSDHVRDFLGYLNAFRQNPVARRYGIAGPATCCGWRNAHDLETFIDGVGAHNLKLVTVHNYSGAVCGGRTVTIGQLLDPALMTRFDGSARSWVAAVHSRGLPIAMAETNSAACGGMPGVSNAFVSAVWGLDYMFHLAQDGFRYANFHFSYRPGGGSSYNPIDTYGSRQEGGRWQYRNVAEPLYYAMYLFAKHAAGARLLPLSVSSGANVRAYAVSECAGCDINIFLINKDASAAGEVRVHVAGARRNKASLLMLRAPSLASLAPDVRYGDVQFDSEGRLPQPHVSTLQPDGSDDWVFVLPNASIALLTVLK